MLHRITTPVAAGMNPQGGGRRRAGIFGWISRIIYILISFELGIILLCLPWSAFWENNYLLYLYPQVQPVVANPFFKGFVLGLGIVNILIGIDEIVHIKGKKGFFS